MAPPTHALQAAETGAREQRTPPPEDLDGLLSGEPAWVLLSSPHAEAVWIWTNALSQPTLTGDLCRAIAQILLGLTGPDIHQLQLGLRQLETALELLERESARRTRHPVNRPPGRL